MKRIFEREAKKVRDEKGLKVTNTVVTEAVEPAWQMIQQNTTVLIITSKKLKRPVNYRTISSLY